MTTSTSGYRSLNWREISAASRSIAAATSAALETSSECSRNAQDSFRSGMSAPAFLQKLRKILAHLRVAQSELDRRLQVAELAAAVVALAAEPHRQHALALEQRRDPVGQLDLAAASRLDRREHCEDRRREHVAPHHRERRRGVLGRGLFH